MIKCSGAVRAINRQPSPVGWVMASSRLAYAHEAPVGDHRPEPDDPGWLRTNLGWQRGVPCRRPRLEAPSHHAGGLHPRPIGHTRLGRTARQRRPARTDDGHHRPATDHRRPHGLQPLRLIGGTATSDGSVGPGSASSTARQSDINALRCPGWNPSANTPPPLKMSRKTDDYAPARKCSPRNPR